MNVKKILTWALVVFIAYYLFTQPAGAANFMHGVFGLLRTAGSSLATFLNSL
jgi:hypothetical protein